MKSLQTEKLELAKLILNTENKSVLLRVKNVFDTEKIDLWDELPDNVKSDVDEAISQSKNNLGKSNSTIMKKYKKWLAK